MKITFAILLHFVFVSKCLGTDVVSTEEFKKIADLNKRQQIIAHASGEERKELQAIDHHLRLLHNLNGESGITKARKESVIQARGLGLLVAATTIQLDAWDHYIGARAIADEAAGKALAQIQATTSELEQTRAQLAERQNAVIDLVFNLAPSPLALALNEQAKKLVNDGRERFLHSAKRPLITEEERLDWDRKINDIVDTIKTLPKLSPEQVQREYDAFTENKIPAFDYPLSN